MVEGHILGGPEVFERQARPDIVVSGFPEDALQLLAHLWMPAISRKQVGKRVPAAAQTTAGRLEKG